MMHEIITDYSNGISVTQLARIYNLHRSTIQRVLKRNGVFLRKRSYVRNCIDDVFSVYNEESCYWAGFIAADGHIRKSRNTLSIKLASIDRNHLIKFKNFIQCVGEVNNTSTYSYIDVSNLRIVSDLENNFSITANKTYNLKFPTLPPKLISHFIRGFFDGDGSITKTTTITCSITCASIEFMEKIKEIFYDYGIRLKSKNLTPPTTIVHQISYSGNNAIKIMDWLYSGATPDILLDRKRIKYENLKGQFR